MKYVSCVRNREYRREYRCQGNIDHLQIEHFLYNEGNEKLSRTTAMDVDNQIQADFDR